MRLYKAWSVVDNFMGQGQVRLDWFVVGRTEPIKPYAELIQDYDDDLDDSCYDRILVNELFTESEEEELRAYLSRHHQLDLQLEEVTLPVKPGGLSFGLLLISGEKSFYTLADEDGYDLSMSVLGHYDERGMAVPAPLSDMDINTGIIFLEKVLACLKRLEVDKTELAGVLRTIYAENGLYVTQIRQQYAATNAGLKV